MSALQQVLLAYGGAAANDGTFTFSNSHLLLHGNSVSPILDASNAHNTIFGMSGVTLETTIKPFGTGSIKLSGSTAYYRVYNKEGNWNLGTNSWCFSLHFYTGETAQNNVVFDARSALGDNTAFYFVINTAGQPVVQLQGAIYGDGTGGRPNSSISLVANTWYQVVYSFDGSTLRCFVDGALAWSGPYTGGSIAGHTSAVAGNSVSLDIGPNTAPTYHKDMLFVIGEAVYTSTFTARTTEWADFGEYQTVATPVGSNIKLLLHFDGNLNDSSTSTKTMTGNGNVTTSNAQLLLNGNSGVFDGAGDYITTPDNADFDLGTGGPAGAGDYTIMVWVRPTTTGASESIISCYTDPSTGWVLQKSSGNQIWWNETGDGVDVSAANTLAANTVYNICVSRKNGVLYLFVDGIIQGVNFSTQNAQCAGTVFIGRLNNSFPSEDFAGQMDELILVKGQALVNGNFTVPTSPFANP